MMMKRLLLSVVFGLIFHVATGQQVIGLQEVISKGLENNYSLRISRNQEQISTNNYSLGNAGFLPSLDLRSQYAGSRNNTDRTDIDGATSSLRNIHNTVANVNMSLGWTLFDGFRVQTNYDRLGTLQEMGELNTRMAVENLVVSLTAEYFNLIQQKRLLRNMQFAVELSRERVRIDEERFLLGSGSKLQLLQAEVFLNADSSRMGRQEEVVRASRIRLNELMAAEDLRLGLEPADSIIQLRDILIYGSLQAAARENNTALQMAAKSKELSLQDQRMVGSRNYPYVNFSTGYGYSHNTYQTGTFSDQQNYGMNYAVTVGINLFDGFNQRRRMSNAIIDVENSRLRMEDTENAINADLLRTYNVYLNNLRLVEMETHNLGVAYETLEIALERYRLGALSGLELREVQKSLLEAEERLVSIQYQTKLAEISLLRISGRILEYL